MSTGYSGPSVAATFVVGVINDAWTMAENLENEASAVRGEVLGTKPAVPNAPVPDNLDTKYQNTDNKLDAERNSADADWATRGPRLATGRAAIVSEISQDAHYFIREFFADPMDGTGVYDQGVAWVQNILAAGGSGVPTQAELRARDDLRIVDDTTRASANMSGLFVARGLALPPTAMSYLQRGVALTGQQARSEAHRTTAIHIWDVEVANTAWSIERAQQLRRDALDKCRDYISDWMQVLYKRTTQREQEKIARDRELQTSYYKYLHEELGLRDVEVSRYLTQYADRMKKWEDSAELKKRVFHLRIKALLLQADALALRAAAAINAISATTSATAAEQL